MALPSLPAGSPANKCSGFPVLCFSTFDSIPVTRQEVSLVDRAGQAELGAESDCWGQVLQKRGQGESLQGIHLLLFSVTLLTNAFWSG